MKGILKCWHQVGTGFTLLHRESTTSQPTNTQSGLCLVTLGSLTRLTSYVHRPSILLLAMGEWRGSLKLGGCPGILMRSAAHDVS